MLLGLYKGVPAVISAGRAVRQVVTGAQALFPNVEKTNNERFTTDDPDAVESMRRGTKDEASDPGQRKPHGTPTLSSLGAANIPGGAFPHPNMNSAVEKDAESAGFPPVSTEHAEVSYSHSAGSYTDAVPFGASNAPEDSDAGNFRDSVKKAAAGEAESTGTRKYSTLGISGGYPMTTDCRCMFCSRGIVVHGFEPSSVLTTMLRFYGNAPGYDSDVSATTTSTRVKDGIAGGGIGAAGPVEAAEGPNFNPYDGSASPQGRGSKGYPGNANQAQVDRPDSSITAEAMANTGIGTRSGAAEDDVAVTSVGTTSGARSKRGGIPSEVLRDPEIAGGEKGHTEHILDEGTKIGNEMLKSKITEQGEK